jgi:RHS repeat-associated protein
VTAYNGDIYTWDVRGRVVGLSRTGLTASFGYRQDGTRTSKTVNGSTTSYLLDGDSILKETTGGVATDVFQGPGVDAVLKRGSRWLTPDGLGSTSTLTDSGGTVQQRYAYQPFGQASPNPSPGDPQPFQFAGRENDGTGLYYCRARYYVPDWGRFLSEDLAGSGLNWYLYCNNNPVNCTDPTGHDWLNNAANFFGGYGDGLTGGLTKTVRGWLGAGEVVDESSQAYRAGVGVGIGHAVLLSVVEGGAGAAGAAGDAEAGAAAGAGEAASGAEGAAGGETAAGSGAEAGGGANPGPGEGGPTGADTTKEIVTRPTPGRDGATSRHIIERAGDETISVTHQVERDGEIIHQHQRYIGKYKGIREFPNEWSEYPDIGR